MTIDPIMIDIVCTINPIDQPIFDHDRIAIPYSVYIDHNIW